MKLFSYAFCAVLGASLTAAYSNPAERQAFFGETHVHTAYSFDAYTFGNRNTPDDAYRFAKGEAINHPAGFEMKLDRPLDFQAVTDHAMYLGVIPALFDPDSTIADHPLGVSLRAAETARERREAFQGIFPYLTMKPEESDLYNREIISSAWQDIINKAEEHNQPGTFTTFVGYEYTISQDQFENLHRNVIFASERIPDLPFSRLESMNPEDLWVWMDDLRAKGIDSIAIPHNSNGSNGYMFRPLTFDGNPIDPTYSQTRMRNEPIVEMTQVKGTSDTHPLLSPNDEWADFEIMPYQIATWRYSRPEGSYIRSAYQEGLKLQQAGLGNPFKFGLIGASDTHVGAGAFREDDYWSKIGMVDATGKLRGSVPLSWTERLFVAYGRWMDKLFPSEVSQQMDIGAQPPDPAPGFLTMQWNTWSASGLAGVWADENTREAIFAAMRRKETFATSGPRLRVRLFASTQYRDKILDAPTMVETAYAQGVPMGSDLVAGRTAPVFLAWALRDPLSAPLQRVQIIKGWLDEDGNTHERVYDVACAGGVAVNPQTHRCPDNNAKVALSDCSYTADTGADELKTLWRDPDYKPREKAFYYLRALENPTCRWSSWDALRAGTEFNPSMKATLQERAWSSPIWVN